MSAEKALPSLPLKTDLESKKVLKKLTRARAALAHLNGLAESIPNKRIIINTLSLQEAKDSSAIENIITTHDDLYTSDALSRVFSTTAAKEVYNYANALLYGYAQVKETGLLTVNQIIALQQKLEENDAGFRKLPGTVLKNDQTGEVVYTPPQSALEIEGLMQNLEKFMNVEELGEEDPLVKMAVIHHQFESIHPFYDGNGRTGRIINILYLVKEGLLKLPILYLSRYINQNKSAYYRLLQQVRETGEWEPWILYILDAVEHTAIQAAEIVKEIKRQMLSHKQNIRSNLPNIYSQDLINSLFKHPYTKIAYLQKDLDIARKTASRYLEQLCSLGILTKKKLGKENYYFNDGLIDILVNIGSLRQTNEAAENISTTRLKN